MASANFHTLHYSSPLLPPSGMIAYLHMTPVAAHIVNFATKLSIKKLTNRYARNLRVLIRLARLSCERRREEGRVGVGK